MSHAETARGGKRRRYVLLNGVWAVIFLNSLTSITTELADSGWSWRDVDAGHLLLRWLIGLPIYFVGGVLFGFLWWEFGAGAREVSAGTEERTPEQTPKH